MPVQIKCPHCQTPCTVAEGNADRVLRCGNCQKTFRLKAPAAKPPVPAAEVPERKPANPPDVRNVPHASDLTTAPRPPGAPRLPQKTAPNADDVKDVILVDDGESSPRAAQKPRSSMGLILGAVAGLFLLFVVGGVGIAGVVAFTFRPTWMGFADPVVASATEIPRSSQPVLNKPVGTAPAGGVPGHDRPVDRPAADKPAFDKPALDKPALDKPALDRPALDKPIVGKPVGDKPLGDKPIGGKPVGGISLEPAPPIKPAPLAGGKATTVSLPSAVECLCHGGGGRYLILHLPKDRKLAIFDANEAKIVKYLPIAEDKVFIAAGLDKLFVVLPNANTIQRWSLTTFEKELTVPSPLKEQTTVALMGSASRGPLLVAGPTDNFGGGASLLLDAATLKPLPDAAPDGFGRGIFSRVSGDGRLFTTYNPGSSPQGQTIQLLQGDQIVRIGFDRDNHDVGVEGHVAPGPDGRYIFSAKGVFNEQGKPIGPLDRQGGLYSIAPAEAGPFYLNLDVNNGANKLTLRVLGDGRPVAELAVEPLKNVNGWDREQLPIDLRYFLVPSAKLLAVLPSSNDKLLVYPLDVEQLLAKSDRDYLVSTAKPLLAAARGTTYAFPVTMLSKKGGVKYKVESGPKGMVVSAAGALTWPVPADYADSDADVILTVSDASGQEVFVTFKVTVVDKPGDRPPEKPPEKPPGKPPSGKPVEGAGQLTIKLAPLKEDREERPLPSAASDVCVGGGGRYLILHLPKERKLAIFDANEAKIVKYLPVAEDNVFLAAGLDKLIVGLPVAGVVQRWSLTTFEKEATAPSPAKDTLTGVSMGSASRGPLLVSGKGGSVFVDPLTFKPMALKWTESEMPGCAPDLVRASADGTLFGMRNNVGGEPHTMSLVTLNGNQARSAQVWISPSLLLPSPDGRYLYTSDGIYNSALKPISPAANEGGRQASNYVPARHGDLFLRLDPKEGGQGGLALQLPGQNRPLATLTDIEGVTGPNLGYGGNGVDRLHYDKRIHLIPDAKLLVTIPSTNDKLILRRFDLDGLLAKSEVDYLFVTSQPPRSAIRGEIFKYKVAVKSKKGGVKFKLDAGPKGMTLSADGEIAWAIPKDYAEEEEGIIVTVSDAAGQDVLVTFKLAVGDRAASDKAPAGEK